MVIGLRLKFNLEFGLGIRVRVIFKVTIMFKVRK